MGWCWSDLRASRRVERAGAERVLRGWVRGAGDEVDEDCLDVVRERENAEGVVRNASSVWCDVRIL